MSDSDSEEIEYQYSDDSDSEAEETAAPQEDSGDEGKEEVRETQLPDVRRRQLNDTQFFSNARNASLSTLNTT